MEVGEEGMGELTGENFELGEVRESGGDEDESGRRDLSGRDAEIDEWFGIDGAEYWRPILWRDERLDSETGEGLEAREEARDHRSGIALEAEEFDLVRRQFDDVLRLQLDPLRRDRSLILL